MKTFKRTSLPREIKYNGKIFTRNNDLSNDLALGKTSIFKLSTLTQPNPCILVEVLPAWLKGVSDLHGRPYKPTQWIFTAKNTSL